jgi:hypothetical protein
MARRLVRLALITLALLAIAAYVSPRLGTTAEYPSDIFTEQDEPIDDGAAQGFRTDEGDAELLISGTPNVRQDTPQTYVEKYIDPSGVEVTQRLVTGSFYILAGTRGSHMLYERCNFPAAPDGTIRCIGVRYPASESAKWEPIVTRIGNSLR